MWMYKTECIKDIRGDIERTLEKCIENKKEDTHIGPLHSLLRQILRALATLF